MSLQNNRLVQWLLQPRLLLDLFLLLNLSFLAPDIYLAHSVNDFHHPAEWIPFYFSIFSPLVLLVGMLLERGRRSAGYWLGLLVGWGSVSVGVAGMLLHLDSQFFAAQSLHSLVYTAPFVAPLAYTGLGLLVIMNRMTEPGSLEWAQWVLLLAAGGFIGNFILSLADHAQNGFFEVTEWIPVITSAFAIGFLLVACSPRTGRRFLWVSAAVMAVQMAVGLLGFYYHGRANLLGHASTLRDNFIYGAPIFAPLLFPNLAMLALLGLWVMGHHLPQTEQEHGAHMPSGA